jgi:hypothetical protein
MRTGGCLPQGGSLEYLADGIKTLKMQGKKQNRDLENCCVNVSRNNRRLAKGRQCWKEPF